MFKALFLATLLITLVVNIFFLFATKEKPPDLRSSTYLSVDTGSGEGWLLPSSPALLASPTPGQLQRDQQQGRRLFLRSNDFYDYSSIPVNRQTNRKPNIKPIKSTNSKNNPATIEIEAEDEVNSSPASQSESDNNQELYDNSRRQSMDRLIRLPPSIVIRRRTSDNDGENASFRLKVTNEPAIIERPSWSSSAEAIVSKLPANLLFKGNQELRKIVSPASQQSSSTSSTPALMMKSGDAEPTNNNNNDNPSISHDRDYHRLASADDSSANSDETERFLNITVKSSKNHVFISVDNNVIYNSQSISHNVKNVRKQQQSSDNYKADKSGSASFPIEIVNQNYDSDSSSSGTEGRGIHVIVLNQFDGHIMSRRLFDTYSPQQDEELCLFISMIRDGRIMIFAIRDEGSFKMLPTSRARKLLRQLGSNHIMKLAWRDMWAMVVRKSTTLSSNIRLGESKWNYMSQSARLNNLAEGLSKSSRFSDWAPPVIIEAQVKLLDGSKTTTGDQNQDCQFQDDGRESGHSLERRRDFCNQVEGYGRLCDCNDPAPIEFKPEAIENSQLNQVPIIVIASNRPYYLYRMLRSLLQTNGVNSSLITVFIDGFYDEPQMVSRLFNLRSIQSKPMGSRSARISHHYKSSLTYTFDELYPRAKFAIIFEEDLDIAKDALIYFNQTIEVLRTDPTLYCISAWNDQGYEHSVGSSGQSDEQLLYRIETMPGLGWMLSKELFKTELEPNWPSYEIQHDWDMWIRTQKIRKNRECIIPDISRTFHFGSMGTNINSYFQKQYFSKHAFANLNNNNYNHSSRFQNVNKLNYVAYESLIESLVINGNVITRITSKSPRNDTELLCSLASEEYNIRSNFKDSEIAKQKLSHRQYNHHDEDHYHHTDEQLAKNNVIYIDMIDSEDFGNWLKLARCWRIWDLDARGQHNSMWRLFINNTPTLVIGVPASPYSQFKPPYIEPFNLTILD